MVLIMEMEKIWYELVKIYQNNVNVVTFTTSLNKILSEINTTAMGVFSQKYTNKTAKDY